MKSKLSEWVYDHGAAVALLGTLAFWLLFGLTFYLVATSGSAP